ncbi:MAG TPA: HemK/PrmC family methyltransferase [Micavibrio sp.]|nr:HemK/PrmC family methyltransferase [Micavibrio sp.]
MLSATKTTPETIPNPAADRLSHAKLFADELSNSRLRKTKAFWSPEKRAEKSRVIRLVRPWARSTGPKSEAGKLNSSLNGGTGRADLRRLHRWLRLQNAYRRYAELIRIKPFPANPHMLRKRMFTLEKLLLKMRKELEAAKVETPALDARILMRQGGCFSDLELITEAACPLSEQVIENTLKLLDRRLRGEPVSRIRGEREFWGLNFKVTPATLDPRPDTETLVAAALKRAREIQSPATPLSSFRPEPVEGGRSGEIPAKQSSQSHTENNAKNSVKLRTPSASVVQKKSPRPLRLLDLGTGTGCIPIALLKELPDATAVAIDISADALAVSRENAARHGVDSRIEFRCGSWFEPLAAGESFDIITANPPYIPESDIESLAKEVRNHDPIQALSGGKDGLDAYKTIITEIKNHLECGGFALLEIGAGQEKDLARLIEDSNMNRGESYVDLGGILRVMEITMGTSENIFDDPR